MSNLSKNAIWIISGSIQNPELHFGFGLYSFIFMYAHRCTCIFEFDGFAVLPLGFTVLGMVDLEVSTFFKGDKKL